MNRCLRPTLLSLALCAALPLHASEAEASPDAAATGAERSPTELAAVRVQAGKPKADTSRVNAFGGGSWKDTPASMNVLERDYLDRRQVRSLSELASNDASLGDAYAPVGYYQNIAIRGFALDAATGYRFNGLSIAGEQRLALENVQSVEILKGEAGLAAGVMAPGGIINYIGKRPAEVRTATLGTDSEGSRYVAVDVGHWITPRFGMRLNAAWDSSHSYVEHADGRRNFYSLAADWLIGERGKLKWMPTTRPARSARCPATSCWARVTCRAVSTASICSATSRGSVRWISPAPTSPRCIPTTSTTPGNHVYRWAIAVR